MRKKYSLSFLTKIGWILIFGGIPLGSAAGGLPLLLAGGIARKHGKLEKNIILILGSIFVLTCLISIINAQRKLVTLVSVASLSFMIYVVFLEVDYIITRKNFLDLLIKILIISAIFSSIYALTTYFIDFGFQNRASTFFTHYNGLGEVMLFSMVWTFAYFIHAAWKRRLLMGLGFLVMSLALIFSFSRGAWLGAAGALITYGLWERKARFKIIIVMIVTGILMVSIPSVFHRLSSLVNLPSLFSSERVYIWRSTWNMIKAHPIIGIGVGNYPFIYTKYMVEGASILNPSFAHNIFFHIWAEAGLGALLSFAGIVFFTLWKGVRLIKSSTGFARMIAVASFSALVGILIHNQVDCVLYSMQMGPIFWLLVGIIVYSEKFSSLRR